MPQYDFKSLSPIDFEILARDLLQEELGVTLESFKPGRDQGIDFRFCQSRDGKIIIQCKHYAGSGYDTLLHSLRTNELAKVQQLTPSRYILVTSVALSPLQRDEIKEIFSPYIHSSGDVLGKDDVNNLLGKFPQIERLTLKLWLESTTVLEEVLHAKTKNISRYELEKIQRHAELYVQNKSMVEARDILEKFNFCVIAGIPGIGKTILAEMILLQFSRAKYEVIKISEDIFEAWTMKLGKEKRFFYYDDFLGQTSLEEKLNKNEDQRLIEFIDAVSRSKGAKLLLTTREYILNQACQRYEKLDRAQLTNQECIVDLSKYTRAIRAQILYNHVYFSKLPQSYVDAMSAGRSYLSIIDHRNYNPRIIQLLTDFVRIRGIDSGEYVSFFLENLDNPLQIWQHAFEQHLSQVARNLLVTLISLPHEVFVEDLQEAFQSYNLAYANMFGGTTGPQDFRLALRELEGDFLSYQKEGDMVIAKYHNPSVRDFINQYLDTSKSELTLLGNSMKFFEQLRFLWNWGVSESGKEVLKTIGQRDPDALLNRLKHLVNTEPCSLVNMETKNEVRKIRWPISFERKAALIAEMSVDVQDVVEILHELQSQILDKHTQHQTDRDGLVELINLLLAHPNINKENGTFIEHCLTLLISPGIWADELRPLHELLESHPDLFSEEDINQIPSTVCETAANIIENMWESDPELLREEAASLKNIADNFEVNLDREIHEIEMYADEREGEMSLEEEDVDYTPTLANSDESSTDEEIASLFSTLGGNK